MSAQLQDPETTCPDCGRPVRLVLARSGEHFAIDPVPAGEGTVLLTATGITSSPRDHHWRRSDAEPVGSVVAPWLLAQIPASRPRFTLHESTCPVPPSARWSRPGSNDRNAQTAWATLRAQTDARERKRLMAREERERDRARPNLADAVTALRVWEDRHLDVIADRVMPERRALAAGYGWTLGQLTDAIVLAEQARARGEVA